MMCPPCFQALKQLPDFPVAKDEYDPRVIALHVMQTWPHSQWDASAQPEPVCRRCGMQYTPSTVPEKCVKCDLPMPCINRLGKQMERMCAEKPAMGPFFGVLLYHNTTNAVQLLRSMLREYNAKTVEVPQWL